MVRKNNFKTFNCLIFSLLLICCGEKKILNSNYSFEYEDLFNSYNSKTGIFKRKYYDDTVRIKIVLTKEEKERILMSFVENKFENFPNEIDCSKWGYNPQHYDYIKLNNHNVKYIYNGSGDIGWFCPTGKRFNRISNIILDILLRKPEVKKLKPSDIYYE